MFPFRHMDITLGGCGLRAHPAASSSMYYRSTWFGCEMQLRGARGGKLLPRATRSSEFLSEDILSGFEYLQIFLSHFSIFTFFFLQILLLWRLPGVILRPKQCKTPCDYPQLTTHDGWTHW